MLSTRRQPSPHRTPSPRHLLTQMAELAADPALRTRLRPDTHARTWARIDSPDGCEAWLIGWPPGTGTGWHDHGGACGAFTVLEGSLVERTPVSAPGPDTDTVALPPGGPHRHALAAGTGRAFGPRHVHDVLNDGPAPAVSLHLYDPALPLMRRFEERGGTLHVVAVETAGAWS